MRPADLDPEPALRLPRHTHYLLARPDVETEVLRHPAVVEQPVMPSRLLVARDEGNVADLDPLRSGKERHAERVALDGRDDGAAVEQHARHFRLLGGDAHGQAAGPGTDDQELGRLAHTSMI